MTIPRADRVADSVRRELARLLPTLRDRRVAFPTITEVRLSPDLRQARVYVTVLGSDDVEESVRALNRAAPFLRRSLARSAGLRFTPELFFHYDEIVEGGMRLEGILRDLETAREPDEPEETDETGEVPDDDGESS